MKFSRSVVVIAWALMATSAFAQEVKSDNAAATVQPAQVVQAAPVVQTVKVETKAEVKAEAKSETKEVSKADELKQKRQEAEQKNDSKIVEKLEKTRLEEEKNLAEKIDSTDLKSTEQKTEQKSEAVQAAPVVQQQQQPVRVEIVQPVQEAPVTAVAKEEKKEEAKQEEQNADKWYVGAGIGGLQYSSGNVTTKSSYGFQVGTLIEDRLMLEASLGITSLNVSSYTYYPLYQNVDQYDMAIAAKYILSNTGKFHPFVGVDGDYIMRTYKNSYTTYGQNSTNAFDVGIIGGADFAITKSILIGGEVKYSFNVYKVKDNASNYSSYYQSVRPLEETSFTSFIISAKYLF